MLRIVKSFLTIAVVAAIAVGATGALFSDSETSVGNSFTAGTLDLIVDGGNTNVVKFNLTNLRPGNQPGGSYTLANVGSISGYLDVTNISVTTSENGILDMESDAGDTTADEGELDDVLNLRLYVDRDGNGSISTGDYVFYNDKVANLPASFDINEPLAAGGSTKIKALFDWWNTSIDNQAQGDGFVLDMTFDLSQNM